MNQAQRNYTKRRIQEIADVKCSNIEQETGFVENIDSYRNRSFDFNERHILRLILDGELLPELDVMKVFKKEFKKNGRYPSVTPSDFCNPKHLKKHEDKARAEFEQNKIDANERMKRVRAESSRLQDLVMLDEDFLLSKIEVFDNQEF